MVSTRLVHTGKCCSEDTLLPEDASAQGAWPVSIVDAEDMPLLPPAAGLLAKAQPLRKHEQAGIERRKTLTCDDWGYGERQVQKRDESRAAPEPSSGYDDGN